MGISTGESPIVMLIAANQWKDRRAPVLQGRNDSFHSYGFGPRDEPQLAFQWEMYVMHAIGHNILVQGGTSDKWHCLRQMSQRKL